MPEKADDASGAAFCGNGPDGFSAGAACCAPTELRQVPGFRV